jgi:ABC-type branched-subunit amino acid transport system substrate-binding protein
MKKWILVLSILLASIIIYTQTTQEKPELKINKNEKIVRIAVINPQYTSSPPWVDYTTITQLIQQDIDNYCNQNLIDWQFNFNLYDSKDDPDERVEWMNQNGYHYVIGLRSTSECDQWTYYQRENGITDILLMSTGSTGATFNGKFEGHELLFRTHTPDDVTMRVYANYAYKLGITDFISIKSTMHENYDAIYFEEEFSTLGGNIHNISIDIRNVDWKDVIEVASEKMDAINGTVAILFTVLHDSEVDIFTIMEDFPNLSDVEWFMPNNMYLISGKDETLRKYNKTIHNIGLYGIRPVFENNTEYRLLDQRYMYATKQNELPSGRCLEYSAGLAYDSAWLLVLSVIEANSSDPRIVADMLMGFEEFSGVTGPLSFNPLGDRVISHYIFTKLDLIDDALEQLKIGSYDCNNGIISFEEQPIIIIMNQPL